MIFGWPQIRPIRLSLTFGALAILSPFPVSAGGPALPREALQAMDKIYAGDPQAAVAILRVLEQSQPENPLGFLLEAEADWWQIYCENAELRYGMVDAWRRGKKAEDETYFTLADKVILLAEAQFAKSDTAEMHFYAGTGYALKARLYALRGEGRAVAHAGVNARTEFLRALDIDPQMADATGGLGLYNYYVDSLPSAVKMLRFFMGIPGGDRKEGIRQMQIGIDRGLLSQIELRFYLAKNLRNFDQEYEQAVVVAEPLVAHYPRNPVFQLLLGNLSVELGRNEKAAEYFRAAAEATVADGGCSTCSTCGARIRAIVQRFLEAQH